MYRINWSLFPAAIIAFAGFYGIVTGGARSHTGDGAPPLRPIVCFPKKDWGPAPDRDRPCLFKLYEDGSTEVRQRDGGIVEAER